MCSFDCTLVNCTNLRLFDESCRDIGLGSGRELRSYVFFVQSKGWSIARTGARRDFEQYSKRGLRALRRQPVVGMRKKIRHGVSFCTGSRA